MNYNVKRTGAGSKNYKKWELILWWWTFCL